MLVVQNSFGDLVAFHGETGAYMGMAMREVDGRWFTILAAAPKFPVPAASKEEAFHTLCFMLTTAEQPMQ